MEEYCYTDNGEEISCHVCGIHRTDLHPTAADTEYSVNLS